MKSRISRWGRTWVPWGLTAFAMAGVTIYVSAASRRDRPVAVEAINAADPAQAREAMQFNPFEVGQWAQAAPPAAGKPQAAEPARAALQTAPKAGAAEAADTPAEKAPAAGDAPQPAQAALADAGEAKGPAPPGGPTRKDVPVRPGPKAAGFARVFRAQKLLWIGAGVVGTAAGVVSVPIVMSMDDDDSDSARSPASP